jgi:hypothetical protein
MDHTIMLLTLIAQALKVKQSYSACELDTNTKTKQDYSAAHSTHGIQH